jgi:hypothetical protein
VTRYRALTSLPSLSWPAGRAAGRGPRRSRRGRAAPGPGAAAAAADAVRRAGQRGAAARAGGQQPGPGRGAAPGGAQRRARHGRRAAGGPGRAGRRGGPPGRPPARVHVRAMARQHRKAEPLAPPPGLAQVAEEQHLSLSNLRVSGPQQPTRGGLSLFKPAASQPRLSASQQLAQQLEPCEPQAAAAADAYLALQLEGLPPQGFAMRLKPGAPAALELLPGRLPSALSLSASPGAALESCDRTSRLLQTAGRFPPAGHPFEQRLDPDEQQGTLAQLPPSTLAPAHAASGEALPAFHLRARDAWSNLCAPSAALQYTLQVRRPSRPCSRACRGRPAPAPACLASGTATAACCRCCRRWSAGCWNRRRAACPLQQMAPARSRASRWCGRGRARRASRRSGCSCRWGLRRCAAHSPAVAAGVAAQASLAGAAEPRARAHCRSSRATSWRPWRWRPPARCPTLRRRLSWSPARCPPSWCRCSRARWAAGPACLAAALQPPRLPQHCAPPPVLRPLTGAPGARAAGAAAAARAGPGERRARGAAGGRGSRQQGAGHGVQVPGRGGQAGGGRRAR